MWVHGCEHPVACQEFHVLTWFITIFGKINFFQFFPLSMYVDDTDFHASKWIPWLVWHSYQKKDDGQSFCILTVFPKKKKMSSQYQLPLHAILLYFTLTSLPLNLTEVGHIVQWPSRRFWDVVGKNPTPNGILALWAVNGLSSVYWGLSKLLTDVSDISGSWSKLILQEMINNGEWLWNSVTCKIWFTRGGDRSQKWEASRIFFEVQRLRHQKKH